ncbi:MAG: 3-phosphoserine/phosphohydroxythreonine transaminase [Deltaproteobacteria bacterium]|nr:3-phosphoserine/phosphohydroxythreonine transaminase [Deltaproteobacteria bacterium]
MNAHRERAYNFTAGPAYFPDEVIRTIQNDLYDFRGTGLGVMEISHRAPLFEELLDETTRRLRALLAIPASHEIIWATGGGTGQFSMVPMNLSLPGHEGNYFVAGVWAEKAYQEAKRFSPAHVAATSAESRFASIPKSFSLSAKPAFFHYTSNNTIVGTQQREEPSVGEIPLVCDASSDILSRPIDVAKYGVLYACAQKNLGPAGITAVIVRRDLLDRAPADLPILMTYKVLVENKSLYNTIPTFPIYGVNEVLKWVERNGGTAEMERRSIERSSLVYEFIDRHSFYRGHAEKSDRSRMNLSFFCPTPQLDALFIKEAEAANLKGIAGHKLLGGMRASMYNAFPLEGAKALVEFMKGFSERHAQ